MGYYIVATRDADGVKYRPPVSATNAEQAVHKRGVIPEEWDKIYCYPVMTTPTGDCAVEKFKDEPVDDI